MVDERKAILQETHDYAGLEQYDAIITDQQNMHPMFIECRGETAFSGTLYHGSATDLDTPLHLKPVNYRNMFVKPLEGGDDFDIRDATLGSGYYLCADKRRAVQYALYRHERNGEHSFLRSFEVKNIAFYDFRSRANPQGNGAVPLEMLTRWRGYFAEKQDKVLAFLRNDKMVANDLRDYAWFLENLEQSYREGKTTARGYGIQSMLATCNTDPSAGYGCIPLWSGLFSSFMHDVYHVDGFIANQDGEDGSWNTGATYVITNLDESIVATESILPLTIDPEPMPLA